MRKLRYLPYSRLEDKLPEEIEVELVKKAKIGDKEAEAKAILSLTISAVTPVALYFLKRNGHLDFEDYIGYGVEALYDVIKSFDGRTKIRAFAQRRVRGNILDKLRTEEGAPVKTAKKLEPEKWLVSKRKLKKELGREPTAEEISKDCKISIDDYNFHRLKVENLRSKRLHFYEKSGETGSGLISYMSVKDKIFDVLDLEDLVEYITRGLTKQERTILALRYYDELSLKEIGYALDLSESRTCQLEKRILERLGERFNQLGIDLSDSLGLRKMKEKKDLPKNFRTYLPKEAVLEILNAYNKFKGSASEASRHLSHDCNTILRLWRKAGYITKRNYSKSANSPLEGLKTKVEPPL